MGVWLDLFWAVLHRFWASLAALACAAAMVAGDYAYWSFIVLERGFWESKKRQRLARHLVLWFSIVLRACAAGALYLAYRAAIYGPGPLLLNDLTKLGVLCPLYLAIVAWVASVYDIAEAISFWFRNRDDRGQAHIIVRNTSRSGEFMVFHALVGLLVLCAVWILFRMGRPSAEDHARCITVDKPYWDTSK